MAVANYNIQYDGQNRPFTQVGGTGKRSYISPVAMGTGTRPTEGGGPYKTDYGWDQKKGKWTRGVDWGNVLTTGIAGIGAAAALPAILGAAGGGAAAAPAASSAAATAAPGTLASSVIGTGMVPTVAGGTGIGGGMGIGSVLSGILKNVSPLSNVLGNASKNSQDQKNFDSRNALDWERLNRSAPGQRAQTSLSAALAKNYTPKSVQWGGPGSGLRGEVPTFSGGMSGAMTKALQDPTLQQMLTDAIANKAPTQNTQARSTKSGLFDKILGGGALASSILGAVRR